jgi:hypothetical protein
MTLTTLAVAPSEARADPTENNRMKLDKDEDSWRNRRQIFADVVDESAAATGDTEARARPLFASQIYHGSEVIPSHRQHDTRIGFSHPLDSLASIICIIGVV